MGLKAASKMAKHSFKQISKIIDETGNSIQAKGSWTKEQFLEVIRKIMMDFDEETGQLLMPTMYIHPSQADSVRAMIKDTENDPEYKLEFDRIIEQKDRNFMLEKLIENWLTSTNERGYMPAYCQLLVTQGYQLLYISPHGPDEAGKDIIAKNPKGKLECFQLKNGDVGLSEFRKLRVSYPSCLNTQ